MPQFAPSTLAPASSRRTGRGRLTALRLGLAAGLALSAVVLPAVPAAAVQVTAFQQGLAGAAAEDAEIAEFYRARAYRPLWTGTEPADLARRGALLAALSAAQVHGLPAARHDPDRLIALMRGSADEADRGRVEVELSRAFLRLAADMETGILTPRQVDPGMVRDVPHRSPREVLDAFAAAGDPGRFLRDLAPRSPEYGRLLREKMRLERIIAGGGWGAPVPEGRIERGSRGAGVLALRDRLIAMGYLPRNAANAEYDAQMVQAVRAFQADHGLQQDGVVGPATLSRLNMSPRDRLGLILVAMERERWLPRDRGRRHIWVNLTDFTTQVIDDGAVTFETRAVIGKNADGRQTPEFSDLMEYMVINPSWYVPRSIVVKEYLPKLQRDPNALSQMVITDRSGRPVNRAAGFGQFTARTFPYAMRQPPSDDNALGLVKFIFPNKYNIYLHDTPAKNLFQEDKRDYSHGCVRLNDPFDFAYVLLAAQTDDPQGMFQSILRRGKERRVTLDTPVPVHLVYRTAVTKRTGGMEYRDDVYGRDARILAALRQAGVALPGGDG